MEEPRGPRVARDPGRTRSRDCRRGRGAADARHHAPAGVGVVKLATGKGKQKPLHSRRAHSADTRLHPEAAAPCAVSGDVLKYEKNKQKKADGAVRKQRKTQSHTRELPRFRPLVDAGRDLSRSAHIDLQRPGTALFQDDSRPQRHSSFPPPFCQSDAAPSLSHCSTPGRSSSSSPLPPSVA